MDGVQHKAKLSSTQTTNETVQDSHKQQNYSRFAQTTKLSKIHTNNKTIQDSCKQQNYSRFTLTTKSNKCIQDSHTGLFYRFPNLFTDTQAHAYFFTYFCIHNSFILILIKTYYHVYI